MTSPSSTVFLIDVDNTLLDNDRVIADLGTRLEQALGADSAGRYWTALEQLRDELGYVDYLGALQRYRAGESSLGMSDPRLLQMSNFLIDYPFADRLYPGALETLEHLRRHGPTVILSDGDVVFQPRKVQRSGLWEATGGRVLIYVHKEEMLDAVEQSHPARHYVMIDDKLRILSAMKAIWGPRLTTVFVRQGHYALDTQAIAAYAPADITVERISDLINFDFPST
ncbi:MULTISPECIES: HAD family hydrolase [unclassified Variovorax]|uniref:HAD family hydrolase n=1 Tax=unclassified Variovorax TaxID=663243 RepID=UPI000F7EF3F9|nr:MULTISPECIES: HAD family hydrolase [unclassified Variovorax]RSZ30400.1 HAD family hydrolase [Variovorax sp. 553]RSZ30936.1 HAD family hydrolase [Variovorax sp. 679]